MLPGRGWLGRACLGVGRVGAGAVRGRLGWRCWAPGAGAGARRGTCGQAALRGRRRRGGASRAGRRPPLRPGLGCSGRRPRCPRCRPGILGGQAPGRRLPPCPQPWQRRGPCLPGTPTARAPGQPRRAAQTHAPAAAAAPGAEAGAGAGGPRLGPPPKLLLASPAAGLRGPRPPLAHPLTKPPLARKGLLDPGFLLRRHIPGEDSVALLSDFCGTSASLCCPRGSVFPPAPFLFSQLVGWLQGTRPCCCRWDLGLQMLHQAAP